MEGCVKCAKSQRKPMQNMLGSLYYYYCYYFPSTPNPNPNFDAHVVPSDDVQPEHRLLHPALRGVHPLEALFQYQVSRLVKPPQNTLYIDVDNILSRVSAQVTAERGGDMGRVPRQRRGEKRGEQRKREERD